MKKFLPIFVIFTLIAFLFTGCGTQNEAPVITSPSTATAVVGNPFLFSVVATDPDGDTLTYEVSGPTGMVISTTGAISGWTPAAAGSETATVTVSDGTNDPVTQTLTITVITAEETLDIEISVGNEIEGAGGKTYIPGGKQDINVKFQEAYPLGDTPMVKVGSHVVPVFSADRMNWTGSYDFNVDGPEMITVGGLCSEDVCASKPVVVDGTGPFAEIKASVEECDCYEGYQLVLESDWLEEGTCAPEGEGCCGDAATGVASWSVKVYDEDPWDECCDPDPCIDPICEDEGQDCPVSLTCDCIDEVFVPDGEGAGVWVDFFDRDYWVILSLTDEVGNETTYYGWLETDGETDELVRFVELVIDPATVDCWCFGEDLAAADLTLGDCDGTPAEVCYTDPLDVCPVVTVEPAEPMVGEEATITIDYTDAVTPDCPAAYVGPSIKTLPLGIPEEAQELVLTDNGDGTYTATYTFGQEGTDYIYVTDACGDCSPCKTGVTVVPIPPKVCPEVTVDGAVEFEGEMWITPTDHTVTVTFDQEIPIEEVRVFFVENLDDDWDNALVPEDAEELIIETVDNLVYTTEFDFGDDYDPECDDEYIIVEYGDSCCPVICLTKIMLDGLPPCVELMAITQSCDGLCECGVEVWLTSDGIDDCNPLACGDSCTELADWTLEVYDTQPYANDACGDCSADPCVDPIKVCEGYGCAVECNVFGCVFDCDSLPDDDFYVRLTVEDILGNANTTYGILDVSNACNPSLECASISGEPCSCEIIGSGYEYMQCGSCCEITTDQLCPQPVCPCPCP